MALHSFESNILNGVPTPLGILVNSSYLRYNSDFADIPLRMFGSYCLALILEGEGLYRDANGYRAKIGAGYAIQSFPNLAVRYCPPKGQTWYEVNVLFGGPIFDLLRATGILDPARPLVVLEPLDDWHDRLHDILCRPCLSDADRLTQVGDFASFLIAISARDTAVIADESETGSIRRARQSLQHDVGYRIKVKDVAEAVGMSYETFRKRFALETG